jgi:hypothetical protein
MHGELFGLFSLCKFVLFPVTATTGEKWNNQKARMTGMLKREIFNRSDFPDFYRIKSSWVGDSVVKILTYYFNFLGSYAAFSF